jgi:hypothetical protein
MTEFKKVFDVVMIELYLCNKQHIHGNASTILLKYNDMRKCYKNPNYKSRFIWTNKFKSFFFALPDNVKPKSKIMNNNVWCNISKGGIYLLGYPADLYLFEYSI